MVSMAMALAFVVFVQAPWGGGCAGVATAKLSRPTACMVSFGAEMMHMKANRLVPCHECGARISPDSSDYCIKCQSRFPFARCRLCGEPIRYSATLAKGWPGVHVECVRRKLPTINHISNRLLRATCPDCGTLIIPPGTDPFPQGTDPIEFRRTEVEDDVYFALETILGRCQSCGKQEPFFANTGLSEYHRRSRGERCSVCSLFVYPAWEPAEWWNGKTMHRSCYERRDYLDSLHSPELYTPEKNCFVVSETYGKHSRQAVKVQARCRRRFLLNPLLTMGWCVYKFYGPILAGWSQSSPTGFHLCKFLLADPIVSATRKGLFVSTLCMLYLTLLSLLGLLLLVPCILVSVVIRPFARTAPNRFDASST